MVNVWLHSTGDASPSHPNAAAALGAPALAALLLPQILPVFSVVAPCHRGASPVSVRRRTFTTGCKLARGHRAPPPPSFRVVHRSMATVGHSSTSPFGQRTRTLGASVDSPRPTSTRGSFAEA